MRLQQNGRARPFHGPEPSRHGVTVVIPAYNEEHRLGTTLPRLLADGRWPEDCELILVDDGSSDGTAEVARELLRDTPRARVLELPWHAGKGAAVRLGAAAAHGQRMVFMDADLATDLNALPDLLDALDHADVVVGSRLHPRAVVTGRTRSREVLHHVFRQQARQLTGVAASDPQCGFKGFRADAAKILFHLARTDGFGFDVEILMLAQRLGMRIAEVPVQWHAMDGSKVRPMRHSTEMLVEILRARLRHSGKPARRPT